MVHSVFDGLRFSKFCNQPGAVKLAAAKIAGQRGEPAAAEQAAAVAHGIVSVHAGPVGQRRAGDDHRPEQFRADRCEHHDRPSGLAVADDARFAVSVRMKRHHLLQEHGFGSADVLDGLARHGIGQESDEIAGVSRLEGDPDFTIGFEACDTGPMAGARINDDERSTLGIDFDTRRRDDPGQRIVDGSLQRASVDHELDLVIEHVRGGFGHVLAILVAALTHDVPEQEETLRGVGHVFGCR